MEWLPGMGVVVGQGRVGVDGLVVPMEVVTPLVPLTMDPRDPHSRVGMAMEQDLADLDPTMDM